MTKIVRLQKARVESKCLATGDADTQKTNQKKPTITNKMEIQNKTSVRGYKHNGV